MIVLALNSKNCYDIVNLNIDDSSTEDDGWDKNVGAKLGSNAGQNVGARVRCNDSLCCIG